MKAAIEKNKSLTNLITDAWGRRDLHSYLRGLRIGNGDKESVIEELRFLEMIARIL